MNPQATAGRMVHFFDEHGGMQPRAAVVDIDTAVNGMAQLTVFESGGPKVHIRVPYSEQPAIGCWSWMPYQKEKAKTPAGNVSESAEPRPGSFEEFARHVLAKVVDRIEVIEQRMAAANEAKVPKVPQAEPDPGARSPGFERAEESGPDITPPAAPEEIVTPPRIRSHLPQLSDGSRPEDSGQDGSP